MCDAFFVLMRCILRYCDFGKDHRLDLKTFVFKQYNQFFNRIYFQETNVQTLCCAKDLVLRV